MEKTKTFNKHRLTNDNAQEVIQVAVAKKLFKDNIMADQAIFGIKDGSSSLPNEYLTDRDKQIMLSTLQWLGSHVGQCYLRECGLLIQLVS